MAEATLISKLAAAIVPEFVANAFAFATLALALASFRASVIAEQRIRAACLTQHLHPLSSLRVGAAMCACNLAFGGKGVCSC